MFYFRDKISCPFCLQELQPRTLCSSYYKTEYTDYFCNTLGHLFSERYVNNKLSILKIKVIEHKISYNIKIYFDSGYTEVWKGDILSPRIKINTTFMPDLNKINKIKNKIKTLLIF